MDKVSVFTSDIRGVVKKEIPFIAGAWVEFFDDVTVADIKLAQQAQDAQDIDKNLGFVIKQIANWNFIDGEGKDIPINVDGLSKLPFKVLKWLFTAVTEVLSNPEFEDKKK